MEPVTPHQTGTQLSRFTAMLQMVLLGRHGDVTLVRLVAHSTFVMEHVSVNVRYDELLYFKSLAREQIGTRELGKNMDLAVER